MQDRCSGVSRCRVMPLGQMFWGRYKKKKTSMYNTSRHFGGGEAMSETPAALGGKKVGHWLQRHHAAHAGADRVSRQEERQAARLGGEGTFKTYSAHLSGKIGGNKGTRRPTKRRAGICLLYYRTKELVNGRIPTESQRNHPSWNRKGKG